MHSITYRGRLPRKSGPFVRIGADASAFFDCETTVQLVFMVNRMEPLSSFFGTGCAVPVGHAVHADIETDRAKKQSYAQHNLPETFMPYGKTGEGK
ncbi:MAG: hypothetical protein R3C03_22835 [Pirellulaceae bacterium]